MLSLFYRGFHQVGSDCITESGGCKQKQNLNFCSMVSTCKNILSSKEMIAGLPSVNILAKTSHYFPYFSTLPCFRERNNRNRYILPSLPNLTYLFPQALLAKILNIEVFFHRKVQIILIVIHFISDYAREGSN